MNQIIKNLHVFIIIYALWGLYTIYEEKEESIIATEAEIPNLENQIKISEKKLAEIDSFKANLEASKLRVEEVVKQIEKVQKQLPVELNDTAVQGYLSDLGGKIHMLNVKPSIMSEIPNGFYFTKNFKFTGTGTYLQFLILIEQLSKSERLLNVKSLSLKTSTEQTRSRFKLLDIDLDIESYRYNMNYKEKSGVEEIESQFKIN